MSIKAALLFLEHVRGDPELQDQIRKMREPAAYESLCALARAQHFECSPEEFARAFALDWAARWVHFKKAAS